MKDSVKDGTAGLTGAIQAVNNARAEEATSVLLDAEDGDFQAAGAFFYDNELEAL